MSENYYLLDDMEKYFPDFNRDEYKDKSIEELINICRPYYKEHLPVDVTTWFHVNEPDEKLIYRHGCGKQIVFIRDTIYRGLFFYKEHPEAEDIEVRFNEESCNRYDSFQPMVISTHVSKSVTLPVMEIELKSVGVKLVFRDNFHDWNISIESENDIECDFMGTFTDDDSHYRYCQGFPIEHIHGMYKNNHKKFTICIHTDYQLFTFMWLLRNHLYH